MKNKKNEYRIIYLSRLSVNFFIFYLYLISVFIMLKELFISDK